jgi:tripartite-type tricarboxylate transporter receptor subunit TctC
MPRILLAGLIGLCSAVHAGGAAQAQVQAYPSKVIRMMVPAGPGGPTDILARLVADRMSSALGQAVIIDNRGGGGGAIAARAVALAEPDGYTLRRRGQGHGLLPAAGGAARCAVENGG